jgi:Eisosome protein 1
LSAAGAAATLANKDHKDFEHWTADPSAAAGAAAVLAKDYKMKKLWESTPSSNANKAAVLASQREPADIWRPKGTKEGGDAALAAMKNGANLAPQLDRGYTKQGQSNSLKAATGAMANSRRSRSESAPKPVTNLYPDQANAAGNALNAATVANRKPSLLKKKEYMHLGLGEAPGGTAGVDDFDRVHQIALANVEKGFHSAHAPGQTEIEERRKSDTFRAASLVMARQLYALQTMDEHTEMDSQAAKGASASYGHRPASSLGGSSIDEMRPEMWASNLQEAAQKLAAERLARLHDEHQQYRDYYGAETQRRGKLGSRRRSKSLPQNAESDKNQSQKIRSDMGILNSKLAQVDQEKRVKDRAALLAAAQRNVNASMAGIDDRNAIKRGEVPPSVLDGWVAKAQAIAEADSKTRMANHGKIHIGSGVYVDQEDVNARAARNVQPVLDEIDNKAEAERARQEELRLDTAEKARLATMAKQNDAEIKSEQKRIKGKRSTLAYKRCYLY